MRETSAPARHQLASGIVRPPAAVKISAPMIPTALPWLNVATLRMDQQRGRPVLLEFSDLLRPSSLRASAYLSAWHQRYGEGEAGLRVITVFAPWLPFSAGEEVAATLVQRAGITHPVLLDLELRLWQIYENEGWPCRYLFDPELVLIDVHQGEGDYGTTEAAIQTALGLDGQALTPPLQAIDDPAAEIVVPTADQEGCWSGDYEAGEVWAVLEGVGTLTVNGSSRAITGTGSELLIRHERHTAATLDLETSAGLTCHAVCFSPGLAPAA